MGNPSFTVGTYIYNILILACKKSYYYYNKFEIPHTQTVVTTKEPTG